MRLKYRNQKIYLIKFSFTFWQGIDDKVLVEIFLEGGGEFTTIVLDVGSGFDCQPVALLPTEVYAPSQFLLCCSSNMELKSDCLYKLRY